MKYSKNPVDRMIWGTTPKAELGVPLMCYRVGGGDWALVWRVLRTPYDSFWVRPGWALRKLRKLGLVKRSDHGRNVYTRGRTAA